MSPLFGPGTGGRISEVKVWRSRPSKLTCYARPRRRFSSHRLTHDVVRELESVRLPHWGPTRTGQRVLRSSCACRTTRR